MPTHFTTFQNHKHTHHLYVALYSSTHLHHHPPPPPTTTTCEFNDTSSSSTSMPLVTVRPTLPQQEHHFRQRPELIKIVCGIYKSNVIHPPFPPAICRMVTTAGNGNVLLTLVVQGFRVHTRGATATNESDKYSRWTCSFVWLPTKKEWKK